MPRPLGGSMPRSPRCGRSTGIPWKAETSKCSGGSSWSPRSPTSSGCCLATRRTRSCLCMGENLNRAQNSLPMQPALSSNAPTSRSATAPQSQSIADPPTDLVAMPVLAQSSDLPDPITDAANKEAQRRRPGRSPGGRAGRPSKSLTPGQVDAVLPRPRRTGWTTSSSCRCRPAAAPRSSERDAGTRASRRLPDTCPRCTNRERTRQPTARTARRDLATGRPQRTTVTELVYRHQLGR